MWGVGLSASPAARQAIGNCGVAIFYGKPIGKHRSTISICFKWHFYKFSLNRQPLEVQNYRSFSSFLLFYYAGCPINHNVAAV